MSKKSSARSFWQQQAVAQQEQRAGRQRGQLQANQQQAKAFLTKLIAEAQGQQVRLNRLAAAFAERCWRVHELMGLYRAEWERAERAEARVQELQAQLSALRATNGRAKAAKKVR